MKKHTLLLLVMILVLALGTLKSVTAENVDNTTFYLTTTDAHIYNITKYAQAWGYNDSLVILINSTPQNYSGPEPCAGAEWTFTLPKDCKEITGIVIALEVQHEGDLPLEIYLNDISIYNITDSYPFPYFYCFYTGNVQRNLPNPNACRNLNESVLEKIKNAKTLTLRVEMKGNTSRRSGSIIFYRLLNDRSYIYVEYRPVSKAPVPTLAVVFGALIITALLLRRA